MVLDNDFSTSDRTNLASVLSYIDATVHFADIVIALENMQYLVMDIKNKKKKASYFEPTNELFQDFVYKKD